jgi:hypothetical protein
MRNESLLLWKDLDTSSKVFNLVIRKQLRENL